MSGARTRPLNGQTPTSVVFEYSREHYVVDCCAAKKRQAVNDFALGAMVAILAAVPVSIALFAVADLVPAHWQSRLGRSRLLRVAAILLALPAVPLAFQTLWAWSGATHLKPLCMAYAEPWLTTAPLASTAANPAVSIDTESRKIEQPRSPRYLPPRHLEWSVARPRRIRDQRSQRPAAGSLVSAASSDRANVVQQLRSGSRDRAR